MNTSAGAYRQKVCNFEDAKQSFMAFDFKKEYKEFYLPPLEGLWWSDKGEVDYAHKEDFQFISMIRLPDFVTQKDLNWAIAEAIRYPVQSTLYL